MGKFGRATREDASKVLAVVPTDAGENVPGPGTYQARVDRFFVSEIFLWSQCQVLGLANIALFFVFFTVCTIYYKAIA